VLADTAGPVRLTDLIWQVRTAMTSRPQHWQDVVDALRPHVPSLWQRLTPDDQRLFLRHVARYWEVHRHRMPPATAQRITALRMAGRLRVLPGRITRATERAEQLLVRVEHGGTATELAAGWLINATGPAADIGGSPDPLLRDLLSRGLARPDPHRLGIDASPAGAVLDLAGAASSTLFTLGPTLRGVRYETTAVPEIRDQAAAPGPASRHHAPGQAPPRQRCLTRGDDPPEPPDRRCVSPGDDPRNPPIAAARRTPARRAPARGGPRLGRRGNRAPPRPAWATGPCLGRRGQRAPCLGRRGRLLLTCCGSHWKPPRAARTAIDMPGIAADAGR